MISTSLIPVLEKWKEFFSFFLTEFEKWFMTMKLPFYEARNLFQL